MRFPRSGGVLVHPTSFPSSYGIGDLGNGAYQFVDFLASARQSIWQVLPLGPTGYADSPYQSFSAFAGNPLLINPDYLIRDGYLPAGAVAKVPEFPVDKVDFGRVIDYKGQLLKQSFQHFETFEQPEQLKKFEGFVTQHAEWLDDFALFMAIKMNFKDQDGGVWNTWPEAIAKRKPKAMTKWAGLLAKEVKFHKFTQFLFFEQWLALKKYANERGISVVGDVPIFVAFDSADVWANKELFYLDEAGAPLVVAGVPPDYFSKTGQRWGNPLYRWSVLAERDYSWWVERLRMTFQQVDIVRIDHFRGFEAYWEIPAEEATAVVGRWVKGPGEHFFHAMHQQLGDCPSSPKIWE